MFVRYQSFKDCAELQAAVRDRHVGIALHRTLFFGPTLCLRCPAKIDIGPVFNVDPQKRSAYGGLGSDRVFAPVERELVFDVVRRYCKPERLAAWTCTVLSELALQDMTDYDDIRACCSGGAICAKCWPFMTVRALVPST